MRRIPETAAATDPGATDAGATDPSGAADPSELDAADAFGHPALADPDRDDAVWPDGDEDDIDV